MLKLAEAFIQISARTAPARAEIDELGKRLNRLANQASRLQLNPSFGFSRLITEVEKLNSHLNRTARGLDTMGVRIAAMGAGGSASLRRLGQTMRDTFNPHFMITGIVSVDRALRGLEGRFRAIVGHTRFGHLGRGIDTLARRYMNLFNVLGSSHVFQRAGVDAHALLTSMTGIFPALAAALNLPVQGARLDTFFRHARIQMLALTAGNPFQRLGAIISVLGNRITDAFRVPRSLGFFERTFRQYEQYRARMRGVALPPGGGPNGFIGETGRALDFMGNMLGHVIQGLGRTLGSITSFIGGLIRMGAAVFRVGFAIGRALLVPLKMLAGVLDGVFNVLGRVASGLLRLGGIMAIGLAGASVMAIKTAGDLQIAYQTLGRVASLTGDDLDGLRDRLEKLATTQAGAGKLKDIAKLATFGARLGIGDGMEGALKAGAIAKFTEDITKVKMALDDIPAEEAATSIVRILNVFGMGHDKVLPFASALVKLDNASTATGREILELTRRLSGVTSVLGESPQRIMALAAAMRDAGIEVETGGTAMSQLLIRISSRVKGYSKLLGLDPRELQRLVDIAPLKALQTVLERLSQFSPASQLNLLTKMGLQGRQTSSVILQMANNFDTLAKFMGHAEREWLSLDSIQEASRVRQAQFFAKLEQLGNQITVLGRRYGDALMPLAEQAIGLGSDIATSLSTTFANSKNPVAAWGAYLADEIKVIRSFWSSNWSGLMDYLGSRLSQAVDGMRKLWESVSAYVVKNWQPLAEWVGKVLQTAFDRFITWFQQKFPKIGDAIRDELVPLAAFLGGLLEGAVNVVRFLGNAAILAKGFFVDPSKKYQEDYAAEDAEQRAALKDMFSTHEAPKIAQMLKDLSIQLGNAMNKNRGPKDKPDEEPKLPAFPLPPANTKAQNEFLKPLGLDDATRAAEAKKKADEELLKQQNAHKEALAEASKAGRDFAFVLENTRRDAKGFRPLSREQFDRRTKVAEGVPVEGGGRGASRLAQQLTHRAGLIHGNSPADKARRASLLGLAHRVRTDGGAMSRSDMMEDAAAKEREAKQFAARGQEAKARELRLEASRLRSAALPANVAARMAANVPRLTPQQQRRHDRQLALNHRVASRFLGVTGINIGDRESLREHARQTGASETGMTTRADYVMFVLSRQMGEAGKRMSEVVEKSFGGRRNAIQAIQGVLNETPEDRRRRASMSDRRRGFAQFSAEEQQHHKEAGQFHGLAEFSRQLQSSALSKDNIPEQQLNELKRSNDIGASNNDQLQQISTGLNRMGNMRGGEAAGPPPAVAQ